MNLYVLMFWAGALTLLVSHVQIFNEMPRHAMVGLAGLSLMFVGSKLGREFLGLA
jgi:hypothetical protein